MAHRFLMLLSKFPASNYITGPAATYLILELANLYKKGSAPPWEINTMDNSRFKGQWVKIEDFRNIIDGLTVVFSGWLLIITCLVSFAFFQIYVKLETRLESLELVVDSILKDATEKEIKIILSEFHDKLEALEDSWIEKFNILSGRMTSNENIVNEYRSQAQTEYQNFKSLSNKIPAIKESLRELDTEFIELKSKLTQVSTEASTISSTFESEVFKVKKKIYDFKNHLDKKLDIKELQLMKTNGLLTKSKILFETSLLRFEYILKAAGEKLDDVEQNKENISMEDESSYKLEKLLNESLSLVERIKHKEISASMLDDLLELETGTTFESELAIQEKASDELLFDISRKLEVIETQINEQELYIHKSFDKVKSLNSNNSEKITKLQSHSEEWVIAWVSVIYGLFNSSLTDLQNQLLGRDSFESFNHFIRKIESFDDRDSFLEDFISYSKDTCLKVMKEISLLIFEYYLIHQNIHHTGESILTFCEEKIEFEVDTLIALFEETLVRTTIKQSEYSKLRAAVAEFKNTIKSDMTANALSFNELFRQNLRDFYIIHDTMKTLAREDRNNQKPSIHNKKKQQLATEDMIEILDDSFNTREFLSESSYISEDISNSFSEKSFKPFRLAKKQ